MRDAARLNNILRRDAAQAKADTQAGPTVGIVTAFDPLTQSAKVRLQPFDVPTGYLPIRSNWAGNGWGMFAPPVEGSRVDVHFNNGSLDDGYISGRAHGDIDKPLPTPSGEFWLVHKDGASIMLLNDGTAVVGGKKGAATVLLGDTGALKALMTEVAMAVYNTHTHGGGKPPDQKMNATDHLTVEVKAS